MFDTELFPVVVQDRRTRQVLMLGYANAEALDLTRSTGLAHFYSRSRQRLWQKGETSGHVLPVQEILEDCDRDAFLYVADVENPVCHRNTTSCFGNGEALVPDPLVWLVETVHDRLSQAPDPASYTQKLVQGDPARLVQKVGEESVEVVIAALARDQTGEGKPELVGEISDLMYHLTVLMERLDVSLTDIATELKRRHMSREGSRINPI